MLSPEQLEHYRQMTLGERMALSLEMTEQQWSQMVSGLPFALLPGKRSLVSTAKKGSGFRRFLSPNPKKMNTVSLAVYSAAAKSEPTHRAVAAVAAAAGRGGSRPPRP
jgi:hypothetical protein